MQGLSRVARDGDRGRVEPMVIEALGDALDLGCRIAKRADLSGLDR
mgnify:CR=1 FL=1